MECNCTRDLHITLTPLINDTLYRFTVSASGPGGESETPNVFVFQTKPTGESLCLKDVKVLYTLYQSLLSYDS